MFTKAINTLDALMEFVSAKIFEEIYENDRSELNDKLSEIMSGSIKTKQELKEDIKSIIDNNIKDKQIVGFIKQYHINYFEPIYEGKNSLFKEIVNKLVIKEDSPIEVKKDLLVQILFQELYGLSVVDDYSYGDIKPLNEIGTDRLDYIWFQIDGVKKRIKKLFFKNDEIYKETIKKSISFDSNNDLNPKINPEILCQRKGGARVTATIPPYSKFPTLSIRYLNADLMTKEQFILKGSSTEHAERFTDIILPARPNIFVFGDQGSGKTTYLLRLIGSLNDDLSILTIESMSELNIDKYYPDKQVRALFFSNIKTPDNCFETGLRLNRDIVIDGEVRLPAEADLTLQSMSRQSKGSMGTFHTRSSEDFFPDYKNLLMKSGIYTNEECALYDLARSADLLYHMTINRKTGKRYINEITEVILDKENPKKPYKLNVLFKYNKKKDILEPVNRLSDGFIESAFEFEFDESHLQQLEDLYKEMNLEKTEVFENAV